MPGISKTRSIMTEPANMTVMMPPKPVAMGMSELRSAWCQTAWLRVAPLDRTVRM